MHDAGQRAAGDADGLLYKVVLALLEMEELKDSLAFKGVAERLTLGITRILGVYFCLYMFLTMTLANRVIDLAS